MNQYFIARVYGEKARKEIPGFSLDHILWEEDCGIRAGGSICHDGENLYVSLKAKEKEIRAEYTEPFSPVCEDSCLEFFFRPATDNRYINFEINPNGCLYIGFGRNRESRVGILPQEPEKLFQIRTCGIQDGWQADYRIPVSFLKTFYPDFECIGTIRANVYKCGDKTIHAHYLAWNPVNTGVPDFHRPECFGEMIFG